MRVAIVGAIMTVSMGAIAIHAADKPASKGEAGARKPAELDAERAFG